MSEQPRILLALTPLVERTVEHELFGAATSVEVAASAAEADELDELTRRQVAEAVLVSPDLAGLTGAHCARASAAGLRVIGLALDDIAREQLESLGVDRVLTLPLEDGALAAAARSSERARHPIAPSYATACEDDRRQHRRGDR